MAERGLPHSALWDLAKAILMIFGKLEVKGWNTDSMLAILEELIGKCVQCFYATEPLRDGEMELQNPEY